MNTAAHEQQRILEYWFGTREDDTAIAQDREALWWSKSKEADAYIKDNFEDLLLAAEASTLDAWRQTPTGRLALILLTDQFSRHIYRGSPSAFRFDQLAQELCLEGLETEADQQLLPIQRAFFYMPLEHSENLAHQQKCVQLFEALALEVSTEAKAVFDGFVNFARQHLVIIERFGRFPHRNAILNRKSHQAELDFLKQPNSSF